jgi:hypothetical protein
MFQSQIYPTIQSFQINVGWSPSFIIIFGTRRIVLDPWRMSWHKCSWQRHTSIPWLFQTSRELERFPILNANTHIKDGQTSENVVGNPQYW